MGDTIEQLVGVLNGAVGDYLKRTSNGLATPMSLVHDGRPLAPEGIAAAYPAPTSRLVVLVHGLMSTEVVWRMHGGPDYGALLAADLGYTPLYLRFNSGLHISDNGEALDALLEAIVAAYPVPIEEIVLLGHSMGGLVIRSACHAGSTVGERRWLQLARRAIYVGSPHMGAPLERFGNVVSWALGNIPNPYTQLVADIVNLRSSGIKDLRYGSLRREDWEGADADALLQDRRHPVPLLPHIRHYLVAGTLVDDPHLSLLFGDALVPVPSATGPARSGHIFPEGHVRVLPSFDHLRLAHHPDVYSVVRAFCEEEP